MQPDGCIFCVLHLAEFLQKGSALGAVGNPGGIDIEGAVFGTAAEEPLCYCPFDVGACPCGDTPCVGKGGEISSCRDILSAVLGIAVKDRDKACSGKGFGRRKATASLAADNAVLRSPDNGIGIPLIIAHIDKAVIAADRGRAFQTVEHRNQHSPIHYTGRTEGSSVAGAEHDFVGKDKIDRRFEPIVGFYVAEDCGRISDFPFELCSGDNDRILLSADGAGTGLGSVFQ